MRARARYDTSITHTICFPLVEPVWLVSKSTDWDAVGGGGSSGAIFLPGK